MIGHVVLCDLCKHRWTLNVVLITGFRLKEFVGPFFFFLPVKMKTWICQRTRVTDCTGVNGW